MSHTLIGGSPYLYLVKTKNRFSSPFPQIASTPSVITKDPFSYSWDNPEILLPSAAITLNLPVDIISKIPENAIIAVKGHLAPSFILGSPHIIKRTSIAVLATDSLPVLLAEGTSLEEANAFYETKNQPAGHYIFSRFVTSEDGFTGSKDYYKHAKNIADYLDSEGKDGQPRYAAPLASYIYNNPAVTNTANSFIKSLKKRGRQEKFEALRAQGFLFNEEQFWLASRNVARKIPTLFTGPSGVGKTTIAAKVAEVMGLNFSTINMAAAIDPVSYLLGVHRIKDGSSYFQMAPFSRKSSEENNLILLDEINRCPPQGSNILFPALDFQRTINLDMMDDESLRSIPLGRNTTYMATANIGHKFTGTHNIDGALDDRFIRIEMDFPTEEEEITMLKKRHKLSAYVAKEVVGLVRQVRNTCLAQETDFVPSVRAIDQVGYLVSDGYSPHKAMHLYVLPRLDEETAEIIKAVF